MSGHPERTQDYLEHILEALERIQRYTAGKSEAEFVASTLLQDGVLRNLGIIGEAAHRLLAEAPDFAATPQPNHARLRRSRYGHYLESDSVRCPRSPAEDRCGVGRVQRKGLSKKSGTQKAGRTVR
jgi:uncharacterized protein with HEPN domain